MSPTRIALVILLLAVATQRLPAATATQIAEMQPPATPVDDSNQPVATIQATARLVVLDVVVTDVDGHPVKGLKPSDFALKEDGIPQTLASFKEYSASDDTATSATQSLPPNTFTVQSPIPESVTKTVIVVGNLSPGDRNFVRSDLQAFMKTVAPGNPIAMFRQDGQGMHLVQDFTTDPKVLQEAIASNRYLPPLGFPVKFSPRKGSPTQWLTRYLYAIPGRINLVWIYGGHLDPHIIRDYPDITSFIHNLNGSPDVLRLGRIALYAINADGFPKGNPGGGDNDATAEMFANSDLTDMVEAAGGRVFHMGIRQSLDEVMGTGSAYYTLSYVPTNPDWNGAYRKIKLVVSGLPEVKSTQTLWDRFMGWTDDESRVQYRQDYIARSEGPNKIPPVPAIQPGKDTRDMAQRRPISVSPKGDPGIPGYTLHTAMQTAMSFGAVAPSQIPLQITITASTEPLKLSSGAHLPDDNRVSSQFRDLVTRNYRVHCTVDSASLHFKKTFSNSFYTSLEFAANVYRDDGALINTITYTTGINVDGAQLTRLMQTGVAFDQTIAIPVAANPVPGNFFLRIGIHEITTDHIGVVELPAEWIKLPPQATGNNTTANLGPANTLPQ